MDRLRCVWVSTAFNEEGCVEQVILGWRQLFARLFGSQFKMILVNDGSTDQTAAALTRLAKQLPELLVLHQANGGHGPSLYRAFTEAQRWRPEYIFQVDSDNQYFPSDFAKLWTLRNRNSLVLGYRRQRKDGFLRALISRFAAALTSLLCRTWIRDPNIPFRLISRGALESMLSKIRPTSFGTNLQISFHAAADKLTVVQVPVRHLARKTGVNSLQRKKLFRACFLCTKELWECAKRRSLVAKTKKKTWGLATTPLLSNAGTSLER